MIQSKYYVLSKFLNIGWHKIHFSNFIHLGASNVTNNLKIVEKKPIEFENVLSQPLKFF